MQSLWRRVVFEGWWISHMLLFAVLWWDWDYLPTLLILVNRIPIHPAFWIKTWKSLWTLFSIIPHHHVLLILPFCRWIHISPSLSTPSVSILVQAAHSHLHYCNSLLMTSSYLVSPPLLFSHDHSQSDHTKCESDQIFPCVKDSHNFNIKIWTL